MFPMNNFSPQALRFISDQGIFFSLGGLLDKQIFENSRLSSLIQESSFFQGPVHLQLSTQEKQFALFSNDKKLKWHVDFSSREYQRNLVDLQKDPLFKALGLGKLKQAEIKILELTAGAGVESVFLLTDPRVHLTSLERNPLLFLLLLQGLDFCSEKKDGATVKCPDSSRWQLFFTEARDYFCANSQSHQHFDVVYYDPMFELRKKGSALPNKRMQLFRDLLGENEEDKTLIDFALQLSRRFVVKRGVKMPPLFNGPSYSLAGKLVRYDVYTRL